LFGFCLGLLFAGLLIALANPPFKLNRLAKSLSPATTAMRNRRRERGARAASDLDMSALNVMREQWAANEFAFEHAIEAYEELIDTTTERRR
jgi:hypothetical protein